MAYGRRRRRYGKNRKKKKSTRAGKKLLREARTSRVDSAAELAVKLIAKREAAKLLPPNKLFRRYYFCDYDGGLNTWTNPTALDLNGLVVHICQIPLIDNATMITQPPVSDPDMRPNVPNYLRGTNVLAPMFDQIKYRSNSMITIKNINVGLRFYLQELGVATPERPFIDVEYAVVSTSNTAQYGLTWSPPIDQILPYKQWGYSSRLDRIDRDNSALFKWRTLAKGRVRLGWSDFNVREKRRSMFIKCNIPYEYDPMDQNGQQVTGVNKIFLVIRSDTPLAYTQKAFVAGFCKVGFKDL